MTVYGIDIIHTLPFRTRNRRSVRNGFALHIDTSVPSDLRKAIGDGFPLYRTHGKEVRLYSDRPFGAGVAGQPWCYEVDATVRFWWRGGEKRLYCDPVPGTDWHLVEFWLIHLLLPFWLAMERHRHFLHAGAVEIEGVPILFLAPSMGGKSTMTDYFLRRGCGLISDDKVAILRENDRYKAVPSHPYHRPWRANEELGQPAPRCAAEPLPLRTLYFLEKAAPDAEVRLRPLRGMARFQALLPHLLYRFDFLKREQTALLASLADRTSCVAVTVPWRLSRLEEVYDAILSDTKHSAGAQR